MRKTHVVLSCVVSLVLSLSLAWSKSTKDDFDRLDGMGKSGARVDVIEWAGNLEVHVYPKGMLKGLALKLDKRNKNKPVMVIGYKFRTSSEQLIRRAILGIPIAEGFKAYRDLTADDEYDKIIISNNGLSNQVAEFKLDPEPKQLYPEGHPSLAVAESGTKDQDRQPATKETTQSKGPDEDGNIGHFDFR